ncbi:MAG: HPr family phosphocarrier protein [Candidatus Omnitrophota bacterium]
MERIEEKLVIKNHQGLHARPAAIFVQIANTFNSSVKLAKDDDVVDGKSIIAVLSLGATQGTVVNLIVEGRDAKEAVLELKKFLENDD